MSNQLVEWQSNDLVSLGQELQARIAKVKDQFEVRAQQARSEQEVERLRQRLDVLVGQIRDSFQQRVNVLSQSDAGIAEGRGLYDKSLAGVDMDLLVCEGDRRSLAALLADGEFSSTVNQLLAEYEPYNARKRLLGKALKLTRRMAPKLYKVTEYCRRVLKLQSNIEIYVYQDASFNAACYPPAKDKILLIMTSSMLEKFSLREIAFVVGHELGHYLFEHTRFPVDYILSHGEGYISPLHAMKLFAWMRYAEVTADRTGMVCCQDFKAATNAFFKLSSGITSNALEFSVEEYLGQLKDIQQEMLGGDTDPEDWFSTHPFNPLRVKGLEVFARSQPYFRLTGREGGAFTKDELEAQISKLMEIMEPVYLNGDTDVDKKAQSYMLNAGYLVAAANGVVERSELAALVDVVGRGVPTAEIAALQSVPLEQVQETVIGLSKELNHLVAPTQKLRILRDMVVISAADGEVDECELKCLYWLCNNLDIDPSFVDHVLEGAHRGMD